KKVIMTVFLTIMIFFPYFLYHLGSSRGTPLLRCTGRRCCLAVAVWSWTAGRAGRRRRNPSSHTASP
uniref:Uncharacterized protein n=1 Tax=Sinocyclocheilus anshuiensis TaxID=1608454 RepID=A0A671M3W0_9TELE